MTKEPQDFVAVRTSSGSFSTERAVALELADGREVSLFADKGLLDTRSSSDFLKVSVIKSDPVAKTKTILLPSETFETMSRWVTVSQDKVTGR
jgi:small ligand-binding sensory domain FIST